MKIVKGKIVEATEAELVHAYCDQDWDRVMSLREYIRRMRESGVKITG